MTLRHLVPFPWFGGKGRYHLDFILPILSANVTTFIDVYGGSGAVLVNRKPAHLEVLNDINGDLVTFFRVLRDDPTPLIDAIALTPYSREEHAIANIDEEGLTDHERARRFFVKTAQSINGISHRPSWSYRKGEFGKAGPRFYGRVWRGYPKRLARVADRLLDVQIEHKPALDLIPRYDHADTLVYCDPPYVHSSRKSGNEYAREMSDDDHRELAATLNEFSGRAAVSGYRSPLYDEIFADWYRSDAPARIAPTSRNLRQECLWTNYRPEPPEPLLPFAMTEAAP